MNYIILFSIQILLITCSQPRTSFLRFIAKKVINPRHVFTSVAMEKKASKKIIQRHHNPLKINTNLKSIVANPQILDKYEQRVNPLLPVEKSEYIEIYDKFNYHIPAINEKEVAYIMLSPYYRQLGEMATGNVYYLETCNNCVCHLNLWLFKNTYEKILEALNVNGNKDTSKSKENYISMVNLCDRFMCAISDNLDNGKPINAKDDINIKCAGLYSEFCNMLSDKNSELFKEMHHKRYFFLYYHGDLNSLKRLIKRINRTLRKDKNKNLGNMFEILSDIHKNHPFKIDNKEISMCDPFLTQINCDLSNAFNLFLHIKNNKKASDFQFKIYDAEVTANEETRDCTKLGIFIEDTILEISHMDVENIPVFITGVDLHDYIVAVTDYTLHLTDKHVCILFNVKSLIDLKIKRLSVFFDNPSLEFIYDINEIHSDRWRY